MDLWQPASFEEVAERAAREGWTRLAATPDRRYAERLIGAGWPADCVALLPRPLTAADAGPLAGLTGLTTLDLGGNRIGDAGAAHLRGLTGLTTLDLWYNKIGEAGAAHLRGLTGLTALDLGGNRIGEAGAAHLRGLTGLTTLDLDWNNLGTVSDQLLDLPGLRTLWLIGNPLGVLDEQLHRTTDPRALRELLRLAHLGEPLAMAKVVILGEGGAGKSCLRVRLEGEVPSTDHIITRSYETADIGLDIEPPGGEGPVHVDLRVYDFAGQAVVHGTHRFFMASLRNVYVVCVDATKNEDDTRLGYWLRLIRYEHRTQRALRERLEARPGRARGSAGVRPMDDGDAAGAAKPAGLADVPPIVVVLTHTDGPRAELLAGHEGESLEAWLKDRCQAEHGVPIAAVVAGYDANIGGDKAIGLDKVEAAIGGAVGQLGEVWTVRVSKRFEAVRTRMQKWWESEPWLTYEAAHGPGEAFEGLFDDAWFEAPGETEADNETDREPELGRLAHETFLLLLRDVGLAHWLGDWHDLEHTAGGERLRRYVLNPEWVNEPVYDAVRDEDDDAPGRISDQRLRTLLRRGLKNERDLSGEHLAVLLELMEAGRLAVRLRGVGGGDGGQGGHAWLIPDRLKTARRKKPGLRKDTPTGWPELDGAAIERWAVEFGFLPDYALRPVIARTTPQRREGDPAYMDAFVVRHADAAALVVLHAHSGRVELVMRAGAAGNAALRERLAMLLEERVVPGRVVEWACEGEPPASAIESSAPAGVEGNTYMKEGAVYRYRFEGMESTVESKLLGAQVLAYVLDRPNQMLSHVDVLRNVGGLSDGEAAELTSAVRQESLDSEAIAEIVAAIELLRGIDRALSNDEMERLGVLKGYLDAATRPDARHRAVPKDLNQARQRPVKRIRERVRKLVEVLERHSNGQGDFAEHVREHVKVSQDGVIYSPPPGTQPWTTG